MQEMDSYDLAKLTPADREQVLKFADYLQAVGPATGGNGAAAEPERLRAWIDEDPEERLAYLGLPARAAGQR